MFPIEKYKFYREGNKTIALSTYAGNVVTAVAKCDDRDSFSEEAGRQLAAARCNEKIAEKRRKRAAAKVQEASDMLAAAQEYYNRMRVYYVDSKESLADARYEVKRILEDM